MSSSPRPSKPSLGGLIPSWARPLERERIGSGNLRLTETTLVVVFGLLLATATIHDLVQQTHVNHRLVVDLRSWRKATGHDYHNLNVEQDVKSFTTRDVVCGNVSPGAPDERTQVCLILAGPTIGGERAIDGGYYLSPYVGDAYDNRYGCFGSAVSDGLCGLSSSPKGAPPALALKTGLP